MECMEKEMEKEIFLCSSCHICKFLCKYILYIKIIIIIALYTSVSIYHSLVNFCVYNVFVHPILYKNI